MSTIAEIKKSMTDTFVTDTNVINYYGLTEGLTFDQQFSKLSIESIIFSVVASVMWLQQQLFETHKSEVENLLTTMKPHTLLWYRNKCLAYQYGDSLVTDSDYYDPVDTEAQIIQFAATTEGEDAAGGYLKVKVAKQGTNELAELSGEWPGEGAAGSGEKLAFHTYMEQVKDAGVNIRYVSREADHLQLVLDLYYSPLVLNSVGERLDGTNNQPVQEAIASYLQNLPFDGEFSKMALTDSLQAVEGVKIPQIIGASAKWGVSDWEVISAKYNPEAGWMKVYEGDLTINFIAG